MPTATKAEKTERNTLADLSIREADIVREIERLKSSIASARANLKEQKAIRGELVVLARVQKDKGAQNSLYAIDKDSTRDNQDIADDEAALREMEVQLDAVRNAIFAAEWEARRAELRAVSSCAPGRQELRKTRESCPDFGFRIESCI